jgi:hypothetical protein
MPNERYPGAAVRGGYHALIFANRCPTQVAVWISFDNEWWVTPNLPSMANSLVIPVTVGTYVRWRAISSRAVARYNIVHNTNYSPQSEEIAFHEDVVCWQGEFSCTHTMLGTTLVLTFL